MLRTGSHKRQSFVKYFRIHWALYLLSVPGLIYIIGYKILPLVGLQLAFKNFDMFAGNGILDSIFKSKWVGLAHFDKIFKSSNFSHLLSNTLTISLMKLVINFPIPILLALMINEVRNRMFTRLTQTLVYMPHFLSWVIIHGIFMTLLSANGFVNHALEAMGLAEIGFYTNPNVFRWLLVFTESWKESGWGAIVYLAALTAIDEELYDAAYVDGAGYFKRLIHVTIPGIVPIISLMLLLRLGGILGAGHEQILVMYNPTVYSTADVLSTYIYRIGIGKLDFSTATALGLFESIVGFILMVTANRISRNLLGRSLW